MVQISLIVFILNWIYIEGCVSVIDSLVLHWNLNLEWNNTMNTGRVKSGMLV